MKKVVAMVLAAILMVTMMAGCAPKAEGKIRIGLVQPVEHTSLNHIRETIVAELDALGLSDKIEIIYKNGQGDGGNIQTIVTQFVGDKVDYIVPLGTGATQLAAAATTEIPIVFAAVSYPVSAGLVASMDAAEGNITGVADPVPVDQIFALAQTLTPQAKTFGLVYNNSEDNSIENITAAKAYCDANGLVYVEATIANSGELLQAVQSMDGRADALFSPNDNTVAAAMATLAAQGIEMGLPVYVGADSMVQDGGLATVGIDYTQLGKQVAGILKRLIEGQSVAQNPIETVSEYAKVVNTTTAEAIGVQLPQDVLDTFTIMK